MKTAPSILDLEEVSELDKRALGNWSTDFFGEVHSSNLPLGAMRVIAGFDMRSGMHHNTRTTFYGDDRHKGLAMKIFLWIEKLMEATDLTKKPTARRFLNYMINLRWIILQDYAVLIGQNQRKNLIVDHMNNILQSDLFKDYTDKMLANLDSGIQNDPNAAKIDLLLPGIIQHASSIKEAQKSIHCDLKKTFRKLKARKKI